MRSVLGTLGCLPRESRPDLSGPVSILQSRFKAQVSDMQETNRVVRLAKGSHRSPTACLQDSLWIRSFFVSYGMPVVGAHVPNKHKLGT